MTQQTAFFAFSGGLDLITPQITQKPGAAISSLNYEPVLDGYRRLTGYERFDGQMSPTDSAGFWRVTFTNGTAAINAGDLVVGINNGGMAVAKATAVVTSGSYGALNAVGYFDIEALSGDFSAGEYLAVGGVNKVMASSAAVSQLDADPDVAAAQLAAALAAQRARIEEVPGTGPVLGVWVYNSNVYAFRQRDASPDAGMWVATTAGWSEITFGRTVSFTSGGTYTTAAGNTITGATSGATATVAAIVVQSGTFAAGDAAGYMLLTGQTGNFVAENLNVGANLNVSTIAANSIQFTLPTSPTSKFDFVNHAFSGSDTVMFGAYGGGKAFSFNGTTLIPIYTGMVPDRPIRIAVHQNALFLAFARGSVQFSAVGDPYSWSPILGAGEFNIGGEVSDFISATYTALVILGAGSVNVFYGSSIADYRLEKLSNDAGAYPWTGDKVGDALYMDKGGVRAISASQAFGNFAFGTKTRMIQPLIQNIVATGVLPTGACRIRAKDQYRVFFDDNTGLIINLGKKNAEVMTFDLGVELYCVVSSESDDGEDIYFGATNGFVYQMEKGNSFDGEEIVHFLRLPFWHAGRPQQLKRWHKVVVECEAAPTTTLYVSADFDYGDPYELGSPATIVDPEVFAVEGGGGAWDEVDWDQFYWSSATEGLAEAYLSGVGKNMSLLISGSSAVEPPHTLHGVTYFFALRGLQR